MLRTLAISNYRSLRDLVVALGPLTLVTGPNGSGKSNLYRALRLLAETAQDGVVGAIAREGGLPSTLWAGPEQFSRGMKRGEQPVQGGPRKEVVALRMGFAGEDFGYAIDLGLPPSAQPPVTAFHLDPEIKREVIFGGPFLRPSNLLVDRRGALLRVRDGRDWRVLTNAGDAGDSLFQLPLDPGLAPELFRLRDEVRAWRFYDHFRSDRDAPARQARLGTRTVRLGADGGDLAAAWQTILEIGNDGALAHAVDDAFPGARVRIEVDAARFELRFAQHGLLRDLGAGELSDGTLRYLLWIAALNSPRPPPLMVLNEPETSLHPDLLPALGRLVIAAAKRSQVIVVSHAARLAATLSEDSSCTTIALDKELGETRVVGQRELDQPAWHWPER